MRSLVSRIVVWMMVLCLPTAPIMADVQAAMLYAAGKAMVNGRAVGRWTAVLPGDKIRTGQDAVITIALKNSSILIAPNSGVVFEGSAITVSEGSALVATSSGVTVAAGGLRISPATAGNVRFEVAQQMGSVRVSALAGRLSISDGKQVTLLDPGRQLTTARAAMPGAPQGASSLAGAAIVAIVAAIAGASTGIVFAATTEQADTSPSTFKP